MSVYCVISEFFRQLKEMEELLPQIQDAELREKLTAIHAHMLKVVRIGERAAMDLERGVKHDCMVIPRPVLERQKDKYKLDYDVETYEAKPDQ